MRIAATLCLTLALCLACGSGEEEVDLPEDGEEQDDELEIDPGDVDTGVIPPDRERGRDGDRNKKEKERGPSSGTKCLSVAGNVSADLRLVFDGTTVTGGSLSYADSKSGMAGVVEPLEGQRKGDVMTATGPMRSGGKSRDVEVQVRRDSSGLSMSIDGKKVKGRVAKSDCKGDL